MIWILIIFYAVALRKFLFFSIFTDCAFLRLYNMFKAFV